MQTAIPCAMMRGGTSKGAVFLADDLPEAGELRDRVLLAALGSPDSRQIDGIGGADPLTSKVAIVSLSSEPGVQLDYLFAQIFVDRPIVDYTQNCGNMLAATASFAIEQGLVPADDDKTTVRVRTVNTGVISDLTVQTPGRRVCYDGDTRIDGVPGRHAPVVINFLELAGANCGALLPTGAVRDVIDGVDVTCIDNGMPVVLLAAADFGRTGYESRDEMNADNELKARLESIRLAVGPRMNLGNVAQKSVPKMTLVAPPNAGGTICTRTFIPHVCHASIGVLGAVSVATACALEGSVAEAVATMPEKGSRLSVEHPSGEFTVELDLEKTAAGPQVRQAALLRTARLLFQGNVFVPAHIWAGPAADGPSQGNTLEES